jgi:ribonuclease D
MNAVEPLGVEPIGDAPGDAARLQDFVAQLAAAPVIGLDTEFLRERTYRAQLCLLQLATPERCECIDPLVPETLAPLRPALSAMPSIKIMHAARQDLEVLWPDFGAVGPVFDTQVAASLAGLPAQVGYGDLVRRLLGVELSKAHTRTDWSRRPLSPAQLAYAVDDVRYLFGLRDTLLEQLDKLGRVEWLTEELQQLARPEILFVDPERAVERLKGIQELDPDRQRLAQRLAEWRERRAADRNRPRSWILDDAGLRAMLLRVPRNMSQLAELSELAPAFIENSGADILRVIEAAAMPQPLPAVPGRARPDPLFTACVKKLATVTREVAETLSISPEILATRRDLEELARGERGGPTQRGWRREVVGDTLVAAL